MWPFQNRTIDTNRLRSCLEETHQHVEALEDRYCIDGLSDAEVSMDLMIALEALEKDEPIDLKQLKVLFAPTGPLKEIAIDSGWIEHFLHLTSEFVAATKNRTS